MRPIPRVFFSFCSRDEDFVRYLAADLDAANPHLLWRQSQAKGTGNSKYRDGLQVCSVVLCCVSTAYCGNAKCIGQLEAALQRAAAGSASLVVVYYDPEDLVRSALLVEYPRLLHALRSCEAAAFLDFSARDELSADILPGDYGAAFAALYRTLFERLQGPGEDLAELGRAFEKGVQRVRRLVQRAVDQIASGARATPEGQEAAGREIALALAGVAEGMGHEDGAQFMAWMDALRGAGVDAFVSAARTANDECTAALARLATALAEAARGKWAPGPATERALSARAAILALARKMAASERARPSTSASSSRPLSRASGSRSRAGLRAGSAGAASASSLGLSGTGPLLLRAGSSAGSARSSPSPQPPHTRSQSPDESAEAGPGAASGTPSRRMSGSPSHTHSAAGLSGAGSPTPVKIGRLIRPLSEVLETAKRLSEEAKRKSEEQRRLEMQRWEELQRQSRPYRGEQQPGNVEELTMRLYKEAEHKSKERDKLTESRTLEFQKRAALSQPADAGAFYERMLNDIKFRREQETKCQKNHTRPGGGDVRPRTVPMDPAKERELAAKERKKKEADAAEAKFEPTRFVESEFMSRMEADLRQKRAALEAFEAKCKGSKSTLLASLCVHPNGGRSDGVSPERCLRANMVERSDEQFNAVTRGWVEKSAEAHEACRLEYSNFAPKWNDYVKREFPRCLFAKKAAKALEGADEEDAAAAALLGDGGGEAAPAAE